MTPGPSAILALDAATTACSAAVRVGDVLAAHRFEEMERGQSERLNPMIGEVMAEAGLGFRDLGLVAVTTGPGAFTGLRIGIACARAIALAAGTAITGVTTFDALAHAVPAAELDGDRRLVVCVNGKRRDVFVQPYENGRPEGAPYALLPADAPAAFAEARVLFAGDGAAMLARACAADAATASVIGPGPGARLRLSSAVRPPDAAHVAELAALAAARGDVPPEAPRPFYIRPPDVRLPGATPPRARRAGARAGA